MCSKMCSINWKVDFLDLKVAEQIKAYFPFFIFIVFFLNFDRNVLKTAGQVPNNRN